MSYAIEDLEVLVSTMDRSSLDFLDPMFQTDFSGLAFKILVINQTKGEPLISDYNSIRVINSDKYGLSRSRNLALKNATGKLVLIVDDDVVYQNNFAQQIADEFNKQKDADCIVFKVTDHGNMRRYPESNRNLKVSEIESVSSIELALRVESIQKDHILFDERFGLGTDLPLGEEYLFVKQLLDNGLKICQSNVLIADHPARSSGHFPAAAENVRARAAINHLTKSWPDSLWSMKYAFWLLRNGYISILEMPRVLKNAKEGISILKQQK